MGDGGGQFDRVSSKGEDLSMADVTGIFTTGNRSAGCAQRMVMSEKAAW